MFFALTLAALTQQTATDPQAAERGCIIEALAPAQRTDLAERFVGGEMKTAQEIASAAAAQCAATWKWSVPTRDWQIVHSAAYAAMIGLESRLPKTLGNARLEALFGSLSDADQYGFTLEGGAKLDNAAYAALARRAGEVLAAGKLAPDDIETAGNWFIAYAQFIESDAHLKPQAARK